MSTRRRDSKLGSMKPQLAIHYEAACREVYNSHTVISEYSYQDFIKQENRLRANNIFPRDFAYGVSLKVEKWVKDHGWTRIPVKIFCGPWLVKVYLEEISNKQFEETPDEEVESGALLVDELTVARYYIERNRSGYDITFREAVTALYIGLSEEWIDLHAAKRRTFLMVQALDVLTVEYGKYGSTYDDFIND